MLPKASFSPSHEAQGHLWRIFFSFTTASLESEKVINNKSFTTSKFFIEILSAIAFPAKL